jgi:hypothetical protein
MLSFGTTKLDTVNRNHLDLIIQNAQRLADLDLPHAVRFDLGKTVLLPWAEEFFQPPDHSNFVVAGSLSSNETNRLRDRLKARGLIQAL